MFGLSIWEMLIILVVALLVLGPKKLPEIAKQLGKGLQEFRRAVSDMRVGIEEEPPVKKVKIEPATHHEQDT